MNESLDDKIYRVKCKISFMTDAVIKIMAEQSYNNEVVLGYQHIMYSIEDEFKEVIVMLGKKANGIHRVK